MKQNIHYCIVLSEEQLSYLSDSKYKVNRMKVLYSLIEATVTEETDYQKKGFSTRQQVGQAILSEVELASRLGYDKKTISKVLDQLQQLGIISSEQTNRTSVHTLKCIVAWNDDGRRINNPFYVQLRERSHESAQPTSVTSQSSLEMPHNAGHISDCRETTKIPTCKSVPTDSQSVSDPSSFTSQEDGTPQTSIDKAVPSEEQYHDGEQTPSESQQQEEDSVPD